MPPIHARSAAAVTLVLVSGCVFTDPFTTSDLERAEDARRQWEAAGPDSYTFRYTQLCFCAPQASGPATVTVENGVVGAVTLDSGEQPLIDAFRTIDGVFELIFTTLANHPHRFEAEYGAEFGEPLRVDIDHHTNTADDGLIIEVSAVTPLNNTTP